MTAADTLKVYENLKDTKAEAREGLFIVEGLETIRLFLRNTMGIKVHSLLLKPQANERLQEDLAATGHNAPVHVMSAAAIAALVGFNSCRGALACGLIPPTRSLEWLRANVLTDGKRKWRVLAVDTSYSTSNLGSMIRSASAFGVHAILLSANCCSPWYRQTVRVSMGHVFNVPVVRVPDLAAALASLADEGTGLYAAVIDADAMRLKQVGDVPDRWCCVLGNEDAGVSDAVRATAGIVPLRIAMAPGIDSLSINNANAILLNGLRERESDEDWDLTDWSTIDTTN